VLAFVAKEKMKIHKRSFEMTSKLPNTNCHSEFSVNREERKHRENVAILIRENISPSTTAQRDPFFFVHERTFQIAS
jgi:hypothetical protein